MYKQQIKASSFYRGRFEHGYCVHKNPESQSQYTDKRSSVPSVIMDANAKIDCQHVCWFVCLSRKHLTLVGEHQDKKEKEMLGQLESAE